MKSGLPPVIIRKQDRLDYYDYLEMSNQGDIKPFIRFIAKCTQRTLEEYIRMCDNSYGISVDNQSKLHRNDLVSAHDMSYSFIFDDDDDDETNHMEDISMDTSKDYYEENDKIIPPVGYY